MWHRIKYSLAGDMVQTPVVQVKVEEKKKKRNRKRGKGKQNKQNDKDKAIVVRSVGPQHPPRSSGSTPSFVKNPGARSNIYLASLVDPEHYPGVRYPDSYSRRTAMVQLHIQQEVFYFPAGSVVENPGEFYWVWRPSLVHPLWIYGVYPHTFLPQWTLNTTGERFGLRALADGQISPAQQSDQMFMANNRYYNVETALTYKDVDYVIDPFESEDNAGNLYYGHAFSLGSGTLSLKIYLSVSGPIAVNDTIEFIAVGANGSVTTTMTATAVNQVVFTGTLDPTPLLVTDNTNGLGYCIGRPGIGFRLRCTTASAAGLSLNCFFLSCTSTTAPTNALGLYPVDFVDQKTFVQKVHNYRPVSSSAWMSYQGSTLNDGGQAAALMFGGGEHPNSSRLYNYSQIAAAPTSYEDKVKKGTYQYWVPFSAHDTNMRSVINSEEWTHPYMVCAGNMGTPTQPNAIRLRCIMNMEFISPSQIWDYRSTKPSPAHIAEAVRILANAPTSLSNDSHWSEITKWIKQAARDTVAWVDNNKSWLVPLGTAVGTALLA